MNKRTLFIVFALFIAGLATMDAVRSFWNEHLAVAAFSDASEKAARSADTAHRVLPNIHFQDDSGSTRSLADFRGRMVLLNVWATWCAPCRKEMPSLDQLQKALGNRQFEVVALSVDTAGAPAVRHFYNELGLHNLQMYLAPGSDAPAELAIMGLPTTMLIDGRQREVWRIAGPVAWEKPEVVASVRRDIERHLKD